MLVTGTPGRNEIFFFGLGVLLGTASVAVLWQVVLRHRFQTYGSDVIHERRRIAHELHDTVGHGLLVIALLARKLARSAPNVRPESEEIDQTAQNTLREMRQVVGMLRTVDARGRSSRTATKDTGVSLSAQVRKLIERVPTCEFAVDLFIAGDEPRNLGPELRTAALRVVQEGLSNAIKHSKGRLVRVELRFGKNLDVTVFSTGGRFRHRHAQPDTSGGLGLAGLRERVASNSGSLRYGSMANGGFRLRARFRLPAPSYRLPEKRQSPWMRSAS